jgi:hypothetical protein
MRIPPTSFLLPGVLIAAACGGEPAASAHRDLTLAPSAESATAVVSARELGLPEVEQSRAPASSASAARPAQARVRAPSRGPSVPQAVAAPAPAAVPDPAPAVEEFADPHALAPGQTVSAIPATSGAGAAPVPDSDFASEAGIRSRPTWVIHGDRCIPGRGEVIPRRRPRGFHGSL